MRVVKLLHGWIGAVAAVFVVLVAGSGALLAFMSELFFAQYGDVLRAQAPAPDAPYIELDRIIASARTGYGQPLTLSGILMPHSRVEGVETAMVYGLPEGETDFEHLRMFSVDPWTGQYKGDFVLDDAFGHEVAHFHQQLLAGDLGGTVVAILGVLLAAFALTGIWLWWPRGGSAWRKASRLSLRGAAKRAFFSLHGWTGVWLSLLIVFFGVTGTATSRPEWFGPLISSPQSPPPSAGFATRCDGAISPGEAVRSVAAAHPGASLAMFNFPTSPDEPYRLSFKTGGDLDRIGGDLIAFVHPTCAGLTHVVNLREGGPSQSTGAMMFSLHGGYSFGSVLGDALVLVTATALLVLSVTGVYVFCTHTLKLQRRRREAAPPAAELESA